MKVCSVCKQEADTRALTYLEDSQNAARKK